MAEPLCLCSFVAHRPSRWRGCPLVYRTGPGAGRAGPGFPSGSSKSGYQVFLRWRLPKSTRRAAGKRAGALSSDGESSLRRVRLRTESPLNERAGSSRAKGGTRLNGRFRKTIRHKGRLAGLANFQAAPPGSGNTMLPPGPVAPALVKSCERYRSIHLGSIHPNAEIGTPNPKGQTPVRGLERGKTRRG